MIPKPIHSNFPLPPRSQREVNAENQRELRLRLRHYRKRQRYQRTCESIEARKAALEIIEAVCGKGVRARLDRYMPKIT
jgi:hypothetical protein